MTLTLEQQARLRELLPDYPTKATGRPRRDRIRIFEGILWVHRYVNEVLEGGARWQDQVERFFAHLQNFRRLVVRYERKSANYLGMLQ